MVCRKPSTGRALGVVNGFGSPVCDGSHRPFFPRPTMSQPHFLHTALNDSVTSGKFIDTKFYVFSRRNQSGRVGTPKALFANSRALTAVPYFETRE